MFDSDLDREQQQDITSRRRAFLVSAGAAVAGLVLWQWRRPRLLKAAESSRPREVTVVLYSDSGQRLKKVQIAKVIKAPEEWRKQLSANAYDISRDADTEMAFSGAYWNLHEKGLYRCICCENALFDSGTKFESGTGWPVSGHRLRRRTSRKRKTQRLEWSALRFPARSVTLTLVTYSMTALSPRTCATA